MSPRPVSIAASHPPRLPSSLARRAAHIFFFRWWTWRTTRRLVLVCAVIATLLALAYAIENWRGRRAFAAVTRDAKAAGISFNLGDYAPAPVPDTLNLAKIPLLDHPLKDGPDAPAWSNLKNRLLLQTGNPAEPKELPPTTAPSPFLNRPADLAAIRAEIHAIAQAHGAEELDAYLARLAPVLAELGAAVAERPYLHYDYNWDEAYAITLPQIGSLRSLSVAASHQALVALEDGRPAEAARALHIPLRFASAVQSEPMLVSQLVASLLGAQAIHHVWQGQVEHRWTDSELALFAQWLAEDRTLAGYRDAFAAEACAGVTSSLRFAEPASPAREALSSMSDTARILHFLRWTPSGWLYQNAATIGRLALDESLPSIDPAGSRVHPEKLVTRNEAFPGPLPYNVIARIMTPAFSGIVKTAGQAKTTRDLARLAVALEQLRLTDGAYPEALAPVLIAHPALATLHDPFTGEPYRYRRDADGGFTLWGVGRNARDDGAAFAQQNGERADYDTSDLVWRVPGAK